MVIWLYIYIYIYIYSYMYIHTYAKLPVTSKCQSQNTPSSERRLPRPGNVFSTLCLQANPQLWQRVLKPPSPLSIVSSKGLSHSKMKWWAVYTNLPVNYIYISIYIYIICIIYILYVLYIYHIYILYIIYQTIYNLVSLLKVCNISGL